MTHKAMTDQETFNTSALHLLKQNKKSRLKTDRNGFCRYRGPNGLMCAAGPLISNNDYREEFDDGMNDCSAAHLQAEWEIFGEDANMRLISDLQQTHDSLHPNSWRNRLIQVAKNHNLDDSVVRNFKR